MIIPHYILVSRVTSDMEAPNLQKLFQVLQQQQYTNDHYTVKKQPEPKKNNVNSKIINTYLTFQRLV